MATDVEVWLAQIGAAKFVDLFEQNEIDMESLFELDADDLREIGVPMGPRKKILKAIADQAGSKQTLERGQLQNEQKSVAPYPSGERRQVTVLFADICGYTKLSASLGEEDTHAMLAAYFETADRIIHDFGGNVDKHIGDSVMAVFGAPVSHGNDSERAVRAAAAIQQAMPAVSEVVGRTVNVHIGIACGQVMASGIGDDDHYTVTGDSVNLASRLTDQANAGQTFLSEQVRHAVATCSVEPQGELQLKGIEKPVRAFRLLNVDATVAGKENRPFVGRQTEIEQFAALARNCRDKGLGQIVYLRGEAGIGKTRLTEHFEATGESMGFKPHRALILDFGVGKGQDAIGTLVRKLLSVDTPSIKSDRTKAASNAVKSGCISEHQSMFLYDLLDLNLPPELLSAYNAMDNSQRNRGKGETVASLIQRSSQTNPLLIIIEDVHWADDQLLEMLSVLAGSIRDQQTIMILTSRIEGDKLNRLWRSRIGSTPMITLDLMPLREEDALRLASDFFDTTNKFAMTCVERANGNPLFLDQLLRGAETAREHAVPDSVQSIVQARMDALASKERMALQAASVLGQRFSIVVLQHLINDKDYDCGILIDKALIRPEDNMLLFAHALVQEGVYGSLLKSNRKKLHLRAAQWFKDHDLVLRAEHLDRAEDAAAAEAYLEAAKGQFDALRYEAVVTLVERGIALSTDQGVSSQLKYMLANAKLKIGATEDAIPIFDAAIEESVSDKQLLLASVGLATAFRIADRQVEAMEALAKAEQAARRSGLEQELANIHYIRGNLCFILARIDECLEEHSLALKLARQHNSREFEAKALSGLADANYMRGKMKTAKERFLDCISVAQDQNLSEIEVSNRHMVGWSRIHNLELEDALLDSKMTKALAADIRDNRALMFANMLAGVVEVERMDLDAADEHLSTGLELAESMSSENHVAYTLQRLAHLRHLQQRDAEALDYAMRAHEIVDRIGKKFCGPIVLAVLAKLSSDDLQRKALLREAEEILDEGCVGHNYFYAMSVALDDAIERHEWDEVERYVDRLDSYTKAERLAWPDFMITKGRILRSWHLDGPSEALETEVDDLVQKARTAQLKSGLSLLDDVSTT